MLYTVVTFDRLYVVGTLFGSLVQMFVFVLWILVRRSSRIWSPYSSLNRLNDNVSLSFSLSDSAVLVSVCVQMYLFLCMFALICGAFVLHSPKRFDRNGYFFCYCVLARHSHRYKILNFIFSSYTVVCDWHRMQFKQRSLVEFETPEKSLPIDCARRNRLSFWHWAIEIKWNRSRRK